MPRVSLTLIHAIAEVKHAAAAGNYAAGGLDKERTQAIQKACAEILSGRFNDQFVTPALQGGAGTSLHMNVNEVIAHRAEEISKRAHHELKIHANDHVNMSQSTNDVNPSALRIVAIRLSRELLSELKTLVEAFKEKANEFKDVTKLGRTHIQDAVPTTLGAEFASYAAICERNYHRIEEATAYLYELNLGGTAIGNAINASKQYRKHTYQELRKITGLPVKPAANLMAGTSSGQDICHLSAVITIAAMDLSKIATDLRFMSSGPNGGIGEIFLESLQPGSSIMPGKVNPVLPESMNQMFYYISGKNLTIHQASEGSHLELAIMFPVLADAIISQLEVFTAGISTFTTKAITTLRVNRERCQMHLDNSTAYATLLTPLLGYDVISAAVKESVEQNKPLRQILIEKKIISSDQIEQVFKSL